MDHENHEHHNKHQNHDHISLDMSKNEQLKLAGSATLHCLVGCGIGEVVGMIIGIALLWSVVETTILAILLGFVFGFALGIIPLLRKNFGFKETFRIVIVAEGLSIVVMETAEVLVQIYTPGVMDSGLTSLIFWAGMLLALIAGFIAAFPVNYILIGRGIRHVH